MHSNGHAILVIRERSGLSAKDLALIAEMDRTQLSRIESGERNGTEKQIVAIARALKVPVTAIIHAPESVAS